MSQIIPKFQSGGFFKYNKGVIETDRLIAAIGNNYQSYVQNQNWTNKQKQRFQNSVMKFINGIDDGSITEVSPTGTFQDKRSVENGGLSNDTGNKRFREDQEAAYFVNWVLNAQDPYQDYSQVKVTTYNDAKSAYDTQQKKLQEREERLRQNQPQPVFDINKEFAKTFNRNVFHINSDSLNPNSLKNIAASYKNDDVAYEVYNQLFEISPEVWGIYNDQQTYRQALTDSYNRFKDNMDSPNVNKTDNKSLLYSELTKLGLDPTFLQYLGYAPKGVTNAAGTNESVQAIEDYLWDANTQNWWNENRDNKTGIFAYSTQKDVFEKDFVNNPDLIGNYINAFFKEIPLTDYYNIIHANEDTSWVISTKNNEGKFVKQDISFAHIASNILNYLLDISGTNSEFVNKYLLKITQSNGNTGYVILPSINWNDKTVMVYNPNAKSGNFTGGAIKKVPLYFLTDDKTIGPIILNQLKAAASGAVSSNNKTFSWREGGKLIKKYNPGGQIDYSLVDWDYNKRYQQKLNDDGTISLVERSNSATDKISPGNGAYDVEPGGKEVEGQSWYSGNWLNQLRSNQNLAESWAKGYLDLQTPYKDKYQKLWFNEDGTFNFENFKTSTIPSDGANGIGHDVYRGKVYRVRGTDQYDTLENLQKQGYTLAENATPISDSENPLLDIYELDKSDNSEAPLQTDGTSTPTAADEARNQLTSAILANHQEPEFKPNLYWQPDVLKTVGALGRFMGTNRANKKILDNSLNAIRPTHVIPTRFERGIYGDYAATSTAAQNAAQYYNLAARPISSDASLQAARQLAASTKANEEIWKGVEKNQSAIKTTTEASLKQAKENMESAVKAANTNAENEAEARMQRAYVRNKYYLDQNTNNQAFSQELQKIAEDWWNRRKQVDTNLVSKYVEYNPVIQELGVLQEDLQSHLANGGTYDNWKQKDRYLELLNKQQRIQTTYPIIAEGRLNGVGYDKDLLASMNVTPLEAQKIAQSYIDDYGKYISDWNSYIKTKSISDENSWQTAYDAWGNKKGYEELLNKILKLNPDFKNQIAFQGKGGTITEKSKIKIEKMKNKLNRDKLFYDNLMKGIKLNKNSK